MSIGFPQAAGDSSFSGNTASPQVVAPPANTADGDLLIAVTSGRDSPFSSVPSGWTTLISSFTTSGSIGAGAVHHLPVPDASALPASWSWSFIETRASVLIFRVTGVDLDDLFPASGGTATAFNATDGTTIAVPAVTSGGAGFLVGFTYFQEYDLAVPVPPWNTSWATPWNVGITGASRQQIVVAGGDDDGAGGIPAWTLDLVTQWPLNSAADQAAVAVIGLNAASGGGSDSGTVAVTARKARVAASGGESVTGSAAVTAHKARLSGSGTESDAGAAAVRAHKARVSASGAESVSGTGAVRAAKARVSGTQARTVAGTAAVRARKARVSGGTAPPLTVYPDVPHAVCDLLAGLANGADIETPADLQDQVPWIRVTRTGGQSDLITDTASLVIDVFAAGATEANAIAAKILQRLIRGPFRSDVSFQTAHGQVDKATVSVGPTLLPPTDSDNLRLVTASYNVSMRR